MCSTVRPGVEFDPLIIASLVVFLLLSLLLRGDISSFCALVGVVTATAIATVTVFKKPLFMQYKANLDPKEGNL